MMIRNSDFRTLIPDNPIIVRDLRCQQQTTSFVETVAIVAIALCFSVAMLLYVIQELEPWRWRVYLDKVQFLVWIFHGVATLRMIAAGVWTVTSNELLLDSEIPFVLPISKWRLLVGTWWAAMYQMRGWMLALGIVQLGVVVSTVFGDMMIFNWRMTCLNPCVFEIGELIQTSWFDPIRSLFLFASVVGIAVLETIACTGLGIATRLILGSKLGLLAAVILRFLPVLIFSLFPYYPGGSSNFMERFAQSTWFSFADGGTSALMLLTYAIDTGYSEFHRGIRALYAVLGMFFTYMTLSFVTMWAAVKLKRNE